MKHQPFPQPTLQHPGPNLAQLKLRREAEISPGYVTRRWFKGPRHFYKYMGISGEDPNSLRNLRTIIVSSNLWLSSPADFNDPFDMQFNVEPDADRAAVRRELERMGRAVRREHGMTKAEAKRKVAQAMLNLDKAFNHERQSRDRASHGVTCLTPHPKNLLMWAHYARSHRGICLQFRTSFDPGIFATAIPVEYSDEYPVVHWPSFPLSELRAVMLRKGSNWEYENEYRIATAGVSKRELGIAPRALTAIILGCKFPVEERPQLERILAERRDAGLPPIKILRARMGSSHYGIKCFKEISS